MRFFLFGLLCAVSASISPAYDFITSPPVRWPAGNVPINVQMDYTATATPTLMDGKTSWDAVARDAFDRWNSFIGDIQFTYYFEPGHADGEDRNQVFFANSVYGDSFGRGVLAVTTTWHVGTRRTEGDTLFNKAYDWNSYRGPLMSDVIDLRRVAIHEFGHTVGLDHPDQAGQSVAAIMNSRVSDVDDLREDDIRGAQALYGPSRERFALNIQVDPPDAGSVRVRPFFTNGYPSGRLVTTTAKPLPGFRVNYWLRNGVPAGGAVLKTRMYDNENITLMLAPTAAPRVVVPPHDRYAFQGQGATFSIRVTSRSPVTYQWQHDGTDLPGQTNRTLILQEVTLSDAGSYSAIARNARAEVSSRPARLVVQ